MNTWSTLVKELKFHGIELLDSKKCIVRFDGTTPVTQGVFKTIRQLNSVIFHRKQNLLKLWLDMEAALKTTSDRKDVVDEQIIKLFMFSLKDLLNYLLCFESLDSSHFSQSLSFALSRDIQSFTKEQIHQIPDYKISIDFNHRIITRLLYIKRLLSFALMGKKKVAEYDIKTAYGVSGPWSRLDLPLDERVFPFGTETEDRMEDKKNQRRYRKGLENYNNGGAVGEGHYWRELRNEPFSWADRSFDDPYPTRKLLNR